MLDWPSFLAGWFAGREGVLGTGRALSKEELAQERHVAREAFLAEVRAEARQSG